MRADVPAGDGGPRLIDVGPAVADVFREEGSRLTASLVRLLGDFELAEDLVHEALATALERWPVDGIPAKPGAWLLTVARRKAVDQLRRESRYRDKLMLLDQPLPREQDDRLRLIFTCCHPALAREVQVTLTLRVVCGLTTAEIARAFVTSEAAIAKRIMRARRKIVEAAIPYRVPGPDELDERLAQVLAVLYLLFNEAYLASAGFSPMRRDLSDDAIWLASLLVKLLPGDPECMGLLALMKLHAARAAARFDAAGDIVLLKDQDRSIWDRRAIGEALVLLASAGRQHRPGRYQMQAAIVACHAEAPSWEVTDWPQILALYDALLAIAPSAVVAMNRAIALRELAGPEPGLAALEPLAGDLSRYHLFQAARGDMLLDLGRRLEAREAFTLALELTANSAEQALLRRKLAASSPP